MKTIPYTTRTGLQIGCRYDRPAPVYPISKDMQHLQNSLLDYGTPRVAPLRHRAGRLLDVALYLCTVLIVVVSLATLGVVLSR